MRLQITIPDEVYDSYALRATETSGKGAPVSPEEVMADILSRFKGISPTDRPIVIEAAARRRLEKVLSGGSLFDSTDLCDKVEALATLTIGDVRLEFTPGQLKQLSHFARRNSKSVDEVVRETVKKMEWQFFEHVGNDGKR